MTFYLCQGLTKTGKPYYYFARQPKGMPVEQIPDGFRVGENANGLVWLERDRPVLLLPEEVAVVEAAIARHPKPRNYHVGVKHDQIVISEWSVHAWTRGLNSVTSAPVSGSCASVLSLLCPLQIGQASQRFAASSVPPQASGTICSISRRAITRCCGLRQYPQRFCAAMRTRCANSAGMTRRAISVWERRLEATFHSNGECLGLAYHPNTIAVQ